MSVIGDSGWCLCQTDVHDGSWMHSFYVFLLAILNDFDKFDKILFTGDTELVQFLDDEIKLEVDNEKSPGKLPQVEGFELGKCEGASIVLTKKLKNET